MFGSGLEEVIDLIKQDRELDAMAQWELYCKGTGPEGPQIIKARIELMPYLLHKTYFYWADQEIQQIPAELDDTVPLLSNWRCYIGTTKEIAIHGCQSRPARLWQPNWWKKGPALLADRLENVRLSKWFAARINKDDEKRFYASGLEIHPGHGARPGALALHKGHSKTWAEGVDIVVNDFIELGSYVSKDGEKVIIKVYEPVPGYTADELWPPDFAWPTDEASLQI